MNRRDFIKNSCSACLSVAVLSTFTSSCTATRIVPGKLTQNGVTIHPDEFKMKQKGKEGYASYIIVRNDSLKYPICIYRSSSSEYTALWLRCTHQGTELQVSGDALQCPAHGSEFNRNGEVTNGPAGANLRTFPVLVSAHEIFIDLRKQS
jgi:nitrite reductase/ring-hydroxylating ferredoxin subunit